MSTLDIYQRILSEWCERAFGRQIASSKKERGIRVLEEALELCQALDVDIGRVRSLCDVVYARPKSGYPAQEAAQVIVTAIIATATLGRNAGEELDNEVSRILGKDLAKFRARMQEKLDAGVGGDADLAVFSLTSVPDTSALALGKIVDAQDIATQTFTPDVPGEYGVTAAAYQEIGGGAAGTCCDCDDERGDGSGGGTGRTNCKG